jgi:hypothetical protein
MRARQIATALRARGHTVELRTGPGWFALRAVRDAVVILVKDQPAGMARLARRNRVVFDAIDFTPDGGRLGPVHAVVCASEHVRATLEQRFPSIPVAVIYHHADPQLGPHRAGNDRLRLVYSGEPNNSMFLKGQIPELAVVPFRGPGWAVEMSNYNAHFSARLDPTKSVVKLANAAATGAVYLTGAEPGCVELLGADYPFFLRAPDRLEAVLADVARLREEVGTALWHEARDRVLGLRSSLSVAASALAYERLLAGLD